MSKWKIIEVSFDFKVHNTVVKLHVGTMSILMTMYTDHQSFHRLRDRLQFILCQVISVWPESIWE